MLAIKHSVKSAEEGRGLEPRLAVKLEYLLRYLAERGYEFEVFWATRTPAEQANLWGQSRSEKEYDKLLGKLRGEKANWLASVAEKERSRITKGRWQTNNIPGASWHQFGEAVDLRVVSEAGRVVWTATDPRYRLLAESCRRVGLYSGYFWKNRDVCHIQLRSDQVRAYYSWREIDSILKERYRGTTDAA